MEWDSKLRAVLDAVSALEALAFNAERIAEHDANCGRVDAAPPPGTLAEKLEWMKAIDDGNKRTRCELRERLLSTGGDRTLTEARVWCERLSDAVVGFGRVDIAKTAPEIMQAWVAFDHALRKSTPGMMLTLDAGRIRKATGAARDALDTMQAEVVAGKSASSPPTKKLPKLGKHDMEAWQLELAGYTQTRIAEMLNAEHGTNYKQPQVSRIIYRAKKHADASGLQAAVESATRHTHAKVSTMDPHKLDMGKRVEQTGHAQRAKDRQNRSDDE